MYLKHELLLDISPQIHEAYTIKQQLYKAKKCLLPHNIIKVSTGLAANDKM